MYIYYTHKFCYTYILLYNMTNTHLYKYYYHILDTISYHTVICRHGNNQWLCSNILRSNAQTSW